MLNWEVLVFRLRKALQGLLRACEAACGFPSSPNDCWGGSGHGGHGTSRCRAGALRCVVVKTATGQRKDEQRLALLSNLSFMPGKDCWSRQFLLFCRGAFVKQFHVSPQPGGTFSPQPGTSAWKSVCKSCQGVRSQK